jgi:hypothetical protein
MNLRTFEREALKGEAISTSNFFVVIDEIEVHKMLGFFIDENEA